LVSPPDPELLDNVALRMSTLRATFLAVATLEQKFVEQPREASGQRGHSRSMARDRNTDCGILSDVHPPAICQDWQVALSPLPKDLEKLNRAKQ
jgi:hypothetical protein